MKLECRMLCTFKYRLRLNIYGLFSYFTETKEELAKSTVVHARTATQEDENNNRRGIYPFQTFSPNLPYSPINTLFEDSYKK